MGTQGNTRFGWSNHLSVVKIQYREEDMTLNVTHQYQTKQKKHAQLVISIEVNELLPAGGFKSRTLLRAQPMPQTKFQLSLSMFAVCSEFNLSSPRMVTDVNNQTHRCTLTISFVNGAQEVGDPVDVIQFIGMGSKMRLVCLYKQALAHMQTFQSRKRKLKKALHLYRNKTTEYFADIFDHHQGIMHPYIKDNNGDPDNPLNGTVNGLFFMANTYKGQPAPPWSGFGPLRILIPLEFLLNNITGECNKYFSDFYCMKKRFSAHYISVVFTENESHADRFCRENLLPLPADNPFFRIGSSADFKVSRFIYVEIFYTKQIDIATACAEGGAKMKLVPSKKTPRPIEGIPKNPQCSICNLPEHAQWEIL